MRKSNLFRIDYIVAVGSAAVAVIALLIGVYLKLQNKDIELAPARTSCGSCDGRSCGCH